MREMKLPINKWIIVFCALKEQMTHSKIAKKYPISHSHVMMVGKELIKQKYMVKHLKKNVSYYELTSKGEQFYDGIKIIKRMVDCKQLTM